MKQKKAQAIEQMQNLIVPLVGIGIVLVIGILIMSEAKTQIQSIDGVNASGQNASGDMISQGWNATGTTIGAISDIPAWLPIIVITVIGAILIGLVSVFRRR